MATAVQKITLSSSRDIPFNKLLLSQSNVRRVKAGISVEELAESIARRGLIQSLHVRPVVDAEGKETGMFEVPAGGRRFRALELLVKQKRLAKIAPVPCVVSEASADVLIDEVSLAENIERAPLHPLDQFRAFHAMREKGMTEEAIAAAFFVDAKVVKQRLRLVSVSPALLDVYAEDGMTLEQLMAFSVSSDHARQEQVWEAIKDGWQKEPYHIRRLLTETTVRAADKRAAFVGIAAYEEAGGCVLRDLFQQDDGGWLQDPVLLDRLVGEKLKTEAEAIAAEGWKWIEVAITFPYGHDHGLRQIVGTTVDLSEEERATREALRDEYDRLEAEYGESAAIILDNWLRGRRKAIWISKSDKLIEDAQRDWSALGMERLLVTPLSRFPQGAKITLSEGILFTTYATLRSDDRGEKVSRVKQIVEWLGSDFDGAIILDESHSMQNAGGGKGERGDVAASQQGRAGLRLQHALPDARVVYVSATGATTVHNLAYAQRLGLWGGEDFPFQTRAEFVEAIESGGVAAMEVLARDLRSLGLYTARSLSYDGVEYELIEHQLTDEQRHIRGHDRAVPILSCA
jgi:ParB/RepB/Spo0J family partition protein